MVSLFFFVALRLLEAKPCVVETGSRFKQSSGVEAIVRFVCIKVLVSTVQGRALGREKKPRFRLVLGPVYGSGFGRTQ